MLLSNQYTLVNLDDFKVPQPPTPHPNSRLLYQNRHLLRIILKALYIMHSGLVATFCILIIFLEFIKQWKRSWGNRQSTWKQRWYPLRYIICDGNLTFNNPIFSVDNKALQIIGYYDDVELANPIGYKVKKHKVGEWINLHITLNLIQ